MSGRLQKKIRKSVKKQTVKMQDEFVGFVNMLPLRRRIKLCWRILWRRF